MMEYMVELCGGVLTI